jgi:Family of unknown function (DUF6678)
MVGTQAGHGGGLSEGSALPRQDAQLSDRPGDFGWDGKWYYHFRSDHEWKDMEWVELKSGSSQSSISTDEITAICQRIGFEIERHGDTVRIIGYRKSHS